MVKLLTRNIAEVLPSRESFEQRLKRGTIKIYFGVDPSGSVIHLGHAVVLWKLREFQDVGHKVVLLVGDFTGMIGDPTDRTAARKKLTRQQVLENAKTYREQISKILRFSGKNQVEIKFNSEWLAKLSMVEVVELASHLTAQQMLERDFFQQRLKENKPIHLHEFLYPLLQGYDSVVMDVDAEIGGTDQTFNMLIGRTLMKTLKRKEKFVITVPLLEGLDGRKMSKSFNNFVAITDEPQEMFGKVMSLNDNLIITYFKLATQIPDAEIQSIESRVQLNEMSKMDAKKRLAWEIVKLYHGEKYANNARNEFERVFQKRGGAPQQTPFQIEPGKWNITDALVKSGASPSRSDAKRIISSGGTAVVVGGETYHPTSPDQTIEITADTYIRVGKKRFVKPKE
ncbi:tyrosine--tRNA ligase [Candidatus Microgenomates bacterium]|nr:tyrosine--tRNA ligase [Candidatus Microgenomates bacterium]